ncbi:DNA topoisomerase [Staphylococcus xylosus]|uniref:type IA DNA topoisomerase n=1 Tax=Staphylococcus xylosus TaxID=1288 RepID=UPI002DB5E49E|nr:DNA topoisomerase [Staphylococcus xylosus]MEB7800327.1 DNA topoisomerase [Staphylococcus xylosus]
MTTTIILAEKPDQAKKYAKALGDYEVHEGYLKLKSNFNNSETYITYCVGHLVSLQDMNEYDEKYGVWKKETLPFIPKQMKYKISHKTSKQFYIIKDICNKLSSSEDIFVIATDPDREGEAIARYTMNKIPNIQNRDVQIKRLWANTQEPAELRKAFNSLLDGKDTEKYYLEAQARGIADWLVGINLTRMTTIILNDITNEREVYNVGRVQTPTLMMVYKRNKEIDDFKPEPFYTIELLDEETNCTFKCPYEFKTLEESYQFINEQEMNAKKEFVQGKVIKNECQKKSKSSPKLFKLGGLQNVANIKWKYSLDQTLKIVQSLYNKGFLSYPRTDCDLITTAEFEYLKNDLKIYADLFELNIEPINLEPRKKYVNDKKVLEHYAIIPTKTIPNIEELSKFTKEELNIYKEVVFRTINMFLPDQIYNQTVLTVLVGKTEFVAKGKTILEEGYEKIIQNSTEKKDKDITLPQYELEQIIDLKLQNKEKITKPPAYLTEATLGGEGGLMESCAKYIENDTLKSQLKDASGIGTPATRASIVKSLIVNGFLITVKNKLYVTNKGKLLCKALETNAISSIELTANWEQNLKNISEKNSKQEQQNFIKDISTLVVNSCNSIEEDISTRLKDDKLISEINKAKIVGNCVKCRKNVIKRTSKNKNEFYKCESCDYILFSNFGNKILSESTIRQLLKTKGTKVIKGFTSKNGKKFDAKLKLDEKGKIQYDFNNNK